MGNVKNKTANLGPYFWNDYISIKAQEKNLKEFLMEMKLTPLDGIIYTDWSVME